MHQSLQYNYKVTQSFDVSSGVWYQTEYNLKKMGTAEFPIELVGNPLPTFSHEYRFNVYTLIENYIIHEIQTKPSHSNKIVYLWNSQQSMKIKPTQIQIISQWLAYTCIKLLILYTLRNEL